ncbi:Serine/threonine-protein kinase PknB [Thalassoglobus neptunius]|uniref:Serine/threonine-protein kinase PknB n=1 Tax=Thalassoglobus neptunius TaxID=1938619 RepID=A0A5C5WMA5_9PLAN|nr:protein kinase [Thalassoglobus neptunius]TWT51750.1 Serine/threonine-protein kinase PknB [Thalassoglobus neptunius]
MSIDEDLARRREINRIISAVQRLPAEQRSVAIADLCGEDTELAAIARTRIDAIETGESFRDLGADFAKSYKLLDLIGQGGMGEVYRATQTRLGRDVAVKKVKQEIGMNRHKAVSSFLREAKLAASINHPGIVPIYDVGTIDEQPCFAMELVEGVGLDATIRDENVAFDINTSLEIVSRLADALAEAHKRGIVHRDLKPANILLDTRGQPKITDFGIARLIGDDGETPHLSVAGSIGYVAPEQAIGEPVDQTADVFSLGAILFTLLTGKPPFVAESTSNIRAFGETVLNSETPAVRSRTGRVEWKLAAICQRCLQPKPSGRYQSAAELATDLSSLLRWRKLRKAVYITGAVITLLVMAGAFFAERSIRQDIAAAEQEADMDFATGISTAFSSWEEGDVKQARTVLAQLSPTSGGKDLRGIEWDYLSFETHKEKAVFGTHDLSDGGLSLQPNGTLLACGSDHKSVQLWDRKTYRKVGELKGHTKILNNIVFSPSGDILVSTATAQLPPSKSPDLDEFADSEFVIWDVQSRKQVAFVTLPKQETRSVVFSPTEACFYVLTESIRKYDYFGRLIDTIAFSGLCLAAHPEGESIAIGTSEGEVAIVDVASHDIKARLSGHSQPVSAVSFTSDGQTILSAGFDGIVNRWNMETRQSEQLVLHGSPIIDFCFDEKNNRVIYSPGNLIYVVRIREVVADNPIRLFGHEVPIRRFPVFQVEFDPSTNELFSWARRGAVRVWDLSPTLSPAAKRVFDGGDTGVSCIGASRDGMIVSAIEDGSPESKLRVEWAGRNSPNIVQLNTGGYVRELAIHPSGDSAVILCENESGQSVFLLDDEFAISHMFSGGLDVDRVAYSHSGKFIATAGHNHTTLWKNDGGLYGRIPTHTGAASDIAFSADDQFIAVTSNSTELKVWRVDDQTVAFKIHMPHSDDIDTASVDFSPDGRFVATGSAAGVRLWNASDGTAIRSLAGQSEGQTKIKDVAFLSSNQLVCGSSKDISLFHPESGELVRSWPHQSSGPLRIDSIGNDRFVSFRIFDAGEITIWNANKELPQRNIVYESKFAAGKLSAMAFLPGQPQLLVAGGSVEGQLIVLNPKDCSIDHAYSVHEREITSLDVSRDGRWIVTGSVDRTVKVLSSSDFSPVRTFHGHDEIVTAVTISPDATLIASAGGRDGTVRLWERQSGDLLHLNDSNAYVLDVQFGLDGTVLMVARLAYDEAWIDVLETKSLQKLYTVECPRLFEIVAHPTAAFAAYCTGDEVVFWDIATGEPSSRLSASTPSAVFSSDGTRLLFPEQQFVEVVIRHIQARKEMARVPAGAWPGQSPRYIAIDPKGRFFAVASRDGVVECWRTK